MLKKKLIAPMMAFAILIPPTAANAATIFSDRAEFLASSGTVEGEGFNDLAPRTFTRLGTFVEFDGFSVTSTGPEFAPGRTAQLIYFESAGLVSEGTGALGFPEGDTLTLVFDTAITAIGFNINEFNGFDVGPSVGSDMSFSLGTPTPTAGTFTASGDREKDFFGVISTEAFSEVTLQFVGSNGGVAGLDDLVYAPAPVTAPIPLPAGLPLLLGGLGAFAALRTRKKREKAAT